MKILAVVLFLVMAGSAAASMQERDILLMGGKVFRIGRGRGESPLEQYFEGGNPRPEFTGNISSSLHRGYIAHWEVRNRRLLLKGVDATVIPNDALSLAPHSLLALFPDDYADGKVFANWYTGVVLASAGNRVWVLVFEQGKLMNKSTPNKTPEHISEGRGRPSENAQR